MGGKCKCVREQRREEGDGVGWGEEVGEGRRVRDQWEVGAGLHTGRS